MPPTGWARCTARSRVKANVAAMSRNEFDVRKGSSFVEVAFDYLKA